MDRNLKAISEFVQSELGHETSGHDYQHIKRVVNLAKLILAGESANGELVLISAYLHDVIDDKVTDNPAAKRKLSN
ncbi:hypothetical protein NBRC111893_1844 [Lentilactobacillus kosonis]|uniref:HD domain-containing protein n=1 Tax=Lentilactobacillus kosonis TaxID=2810561 RepID=A0A401FN58_9LACO|nr:hypothetical protein NBRC111893_1844 [Lentilactobacillus kosonis]